MAIMITFYNQKGGCGKTTTSVSLAAYWQSRGQEILYIDTDPQGSATKWEARAASVGGSLPFVCHSAQGLDGKAPTHAQFREFVRKRLTPTTDLIIIDTPPAKLSPLTSLIVKDSDLVIIPCVPDQLNLDALEGAVELVREIDEERRIEGKPPLAVRLLINKVNQRLTVHRVIEEMVRSTDGIAVLGHTLGDLSAFVTASSYRTSLARAVTGRSKAPLRQLAAVAEEIEDVIRAGARAASKKRKESDNG